MMQGCFNKAYDDNMDNRASKYNEATVENLGTESNINSQIQNSPHRGGGKSWVLLAFFITGLIIGFGITFGPTYSVLNKKNNELQSTIDSLTSQNNALSASYESLNNSYNRLAGNYSTCQSNLSQIDSNCSNVNASLNTCEATLNITATNLTACEASVNQFNNTISGGTQELSTCDSNLASASNQIDSLNNTLHSVCCANVLCSANGGTSFAEPNTVSQCGLQIVSNHSEASFDTVGGNDTLCAGYTNCSGYSVYAPN